MIAKHAPLRVILEVYVKLCRAVHVETTPISK